MLQVMCDAFAAHECNSNKHQKVVLTWEETRWVQRMEGGNDINGVCKRSFRWMSRPSGLLTCLTSHLVLFLQSVTLSKSNPAESSISVLQLFLFVRIDFSDVLPFFSPFLSFLNMSQKRKVHFTSSLPNQDDACCQGDHFSITHVAGPSCELRPVIGLSSRVGGELLADCAFWLAGWLAEATAPADLL